MIISKKVVVFLAVLAAMHAKGSGFALYQPSARSHALGGALLGKGIDGSANFNNPATLSDITGNLLTLGFVTEHPRARAKVGGESSVTMDPGFFILPHFNLVAPLPWDLTFGLGFGMEYGLGSKYSKRWAMGWNSIETTVKGESLNPNLAWNISNRWSVGAGLRLLYFDFEQESRPQAGGYGRLWNRLKGDNDMRDLGWQIGTRVKVTEEFAVGVVYKSKIDVHVGGHTMTGIGAVDVPAAERAVAEAAEKANGDADCDMELPQSVTFGFNWDITPTVHFGMAAAWTEWSTVDTLVFKLPTGDKRIRMGWDDTWRFAVASAWDFAEDWTLNASYVYDQDCTGNQSSTMLPPADRHIVTLGLTWRFRNDLEFDMGYGIVLMDGGSMSTTDSLGESYRMECHRGLSHAVGFSMTYRF